MIRKDEEMPDTNQAFEEIEKHRRNIDEIDEQLVELLNKRAGHSLVIRGLKPEAKMGLFDARREEEILTKVAGYNNSPLYNENLREIYTTILKVMKETPSV